MKEHTVPETSDVKVITACLLLSLAIFFFDLRMPLGVAGGVPYILVVLVSLWSRQGKMPVYMALLGSVLTVAGFVLSPAGGEPWKVMVNRSLALFAIWTAAILSMQRKSIYEERERALADVKVLSGLLPVCASCKRIRDDEGYWKQIESYIRDHSEAEFSHGICPDCARKLYPDMDLYPESRDK